MTKKTNLILGSGGIKGVSFVGLLEEAFKIYKYEGFKNFIGVSIGSFIAVMLIIGYNINELKDFFIDVNLKIFTDFRFKKLFEEFGMDNGQRYINLIRSFFLTKNINPEITFLELYNLKKKNLYIVGSNLNTENPEYFNHQTHPDMKIFDAIRISSSVPFVLTPYKYNNNYYVDGALYEPVPLGPYKNSKKNLIILLNKSVDDNFNLNFKTYISKILNSFYNNLIESKLNLIKDMYFIENNEDTSAINPEISKEEKIKLYNMGKYFFKNKYLDNIYLKILKKNYFFRLLRCNQQEHLDHH